MFVSPTILKGMEVEDLCMHNMLLQLMM